MLSCHKLWIKKSIIIKVVFQHLSLIATVRYDGLHWNEFNLLSMLGRARDNNMKYPNTLWGMVETSFGYPSKGYPKSSWNFILLTRWDGALYKQVARDLEPETRRSNTVMGSHKTGREGWGCAPHTHSLSHVYIIVIEIIITTV